MLGNIVLIFFVKPLNRLTNIPDLRRPSDIKRNLRVKAVAEQMIQFLQLCGGKIDILLGEKQNNQPMTELQSEYIKTLIENVWEDER